MSIKQVIIVRKDLKMNRGKELVQVQHWIADFLRNRENEDTDTNGDVTFTLSCQDIEWLYGLQKKVCLQVNSEKELLDLYNKALELNVEAHLIQDAGLTYFKEPTYTVLSLGPEQSDKLDKITSHLKLY